MSDLLEDPADSSAAKLARVRRVLTACAASDSPAVVALVEVLELTIDKGHECVHHFGLCFGEGTPGHE